MLNSFDLLVAAIASGIGLIVIGTGLAIFRTRNGRFGTLAAGIACTLSGSWSIAPKAAFAEASCIVAIVVALGVFKIGQVALATRIHHLLFRPVIAGVLLALGGMGLIAAGSWRYDYVESELNSDKMELLSRMSGWRPTLEPGAIDCRTDSGKSITVYTAVTPRSPSDVAHDEQTMLSDFEWSKRIISRSPATDESNCHGWVFTGGKYWILGSDVSTILTGNGYRSTRFPMPGDLAIYKTAEGSIEHTAIVRSVGTVTMVEGKWGWMGVFLHAADASCYGTNITYYRPHRKGHQFAVLNPRDAEPLPPSPFNGMQARRPVPMK